MKFSVKTDVQPLLLHQHGLFFQSQTFREKKKKQVQSVQMKHPKPGAKLFLEQPKTFWAQTGIVWHIPDVSVVLEVNF